MIELITTSISLAVVGLAIHQATKVIDLKPFNCELCVVFWVSVIATLLEMHTSYPVFHSIQFVGFAIFTRQLLHRVWGTMF